jgi:hypothetical protein
VTLHAATTPDPDEPVTAMALCAEAGITYRQCDFWTTTGRLHAVPFTRGKVVKIADERQRYYGHQKRYPANEVKIARLMKRLVDAGIDVRHAHDAARAHVPGQPVTLGSGLVLWIEDET